MDSQQHEQLIEGTPVAPPARASQRSTWLGLAAVAVVAVVAFAVAVSAHSRSVATATGGVQLEAALGSTASTAASTQVVAQSNFKSQFAGMMLMNQPACRQTHAGHIACLDLIHSAKQLITDLTDPEVSVEAILGHIENGTYNVGSAVAFATRSDEHIVSMAPSLAAALEDPDNRLTVDGVADLSKCDYVWRGVACLTVVESGRSASCSADEAEANATHKPRCVTKVVPIIHILDDANVEYGEDGKARRRDAMQVIGAVAGGIAVGAAAAGAIAAAPIALPAAGIAVVAVAAGVGGAMTGWDKASSLSPWK